MEQDPLFNSNSYISFDATSINELIIDRLNKSEIFTDQNYQGSNISSLLDVISYTFSMLMFYLNKTSSESLFSESQIYENMNRIVKLLNYNPKGKTSQAVQFDFQASLPTNNSYMIPRYSYIRIGALNFSFAKDIYFSYLDDESIDLQNPSTDYFLYEGNFFEYPLYKGLGVANEVLFLNLGDDTFIDHNNIHVYVQRQNSITWEQWQRSENLFLNKSTDKAFEIRYNPNKNYEIKFGDGVNGLKLNTDDSVLVYYLKLNPSTPTIAANAIKAAPIVPFNSINYPFVLNDTKEYEATVLDSSGLNLIELDNKFPSTPYIPEETVEDIRKNAPRTFFYQQRLVTTSDFESYIKSKYGNLFLDCKVVNNESYLNGHMKYLYDMGINSPQLDNNILYNQIQYSNSCNFNNVYVYLLPSTIEQKYLSSAQKELIINDLQEQKVLTSDVVPIDPVYINFDFYVQSDQNEVPSIERLPENFLMVYRNNNTRQSNTGIINEIVRVFKQHFNYPTIALGKNVDINALASDILNINGIDSIQTYRKDINSYADGLSFLCWDSSYPNLNLKIHNYNFKIDYFQYPVFNNIDSLINKIKIVNSSGVISTTDY
jgi:hypothetical protein